MGVLKSPQAQNHMHTRENHLHVDKETEHFFTLTLIFIFYQNFPELSHHN